MARRSKGQEQTLSGSPQPGFTNFSPKTIQSIRSPTTADLGYAIGQLWANINTNILYGLVSVGGGVAVWNVLGASSTADVNTISGDSGTSAPVGGNIQIAGTANQILTTAAGSTVTLSLIGPYTPATYTNHGVLIGQGTSPIVATSAGVAGQVLTSNGPALDPTFQTPAGGTTADYADFYALMPGDNAATIAVGAAILLPQDGPSSGTSITRLSSSTFNLADIATYSVAFQCSFDEAGQWILKLDTTELPYTVSGRATGTNQCYINCLITTTTINQVLSVVNPTGNSTALTITPIAGGTNAVSAHLVIQRVAGGPGGGLLNTINSAVPIAGDFIIEGTTNQITVTTPGSAANASAISLPAAVIAPGSIAATTSITATLGDISATNGNLVLTAAGNKMIRTSVATTTTAGANSIGSVTLVGGTATISTTAVTANSLIQIWRQSVGATGAAALGQLSVGTIVAGTSFDINAWAAADATALQASDVSVIGWEIIN